MTDTKLLTMEEIEKKVVNFGKTAKAKQIAKLVGLKLFDENIHEAPKERKATFKAYLMAENGHLDEGAENEKQSNEPKPEPELPKENSTKPKSKSKSSKPKQEPSNDDVDEEIVDYQANPRLRELAEEVIMNHQQAIYVPENMPTPKDRRESKYQMGAALKEARKQFPSDKQFGEWVQSEINDELLTKEQKAIPQKTLYNYRQLAEFGSLDDCETVGHNNVYKLMVEGQEENLAQVRALLDGTTRHDESGDVYTGTEITTYVKGLFGTEKPTMFSQEQVDEMLSGYVDEEVFEDMRESVTACALTDVYLEFFGIERQELSMDTVKVAHRAAMKRFHPDNVGNLYVADFQFANKAAEHLKMQVK